MAVVKLTLVCKTCGCEFTHRHECYNREQAESYEEWARENIDTCPDCYREEKRTAEEKKIESGILEILEADGVKIELAELEGSEKQIAWANKIRNEALYNLLKLYKEKGGKLEQSSVDKVADMINGKTAAKWWIENRDGVSSVATFGKTIQAK